MADREGSITSFFREALGAPLRNPRWSWGAINPTTGHVFLRVWDDDRKSVDGVASLVIMKGRWGSTSRGESERREHIKLMRDGAQVFGVVCFAKRVKGGGKQIRSFDSENLVQFGRLIEKGDSAYATIAGQLPVMALRDHKPGAVAPGEDWTEAEIRILVDDYFAMLRMDRTGVSYNKSEHNRALQGRLPGRSKGAIEYKLQNVSGVLYDEGFPYLPGYKPALNYQKQLLPEIVLQRLGAKAGGAAEVLRAIEGTREEANGAVDFSRCEVAAPKINGGASALRPPSGYRRARKYDFAERDARNRTLGRAGEEFVVRYERWYLESKGRRDLAVQVKWVADADGDGLGYDVLSFDPGTGDERYIEVKTTNCPEEFPFYISQAELEASLALGSRYQLVRVFNFSTKPQFYRISGNLQQSLVLRPLTFEARCGAK